MVNSFTYINNANTPLSPRLIDLKKTTTYEFGSPGPGLEQAQNSGGIKPFNGFIINNKCIFKTRLEILPRVEHELKIKKKTIIRKIK
jgi:hypothetical protein